MSAISVVLKGLKAFAAHGLILHHEDDESRGSCPFCHGDNFYIESDTGLWSCKSLNKCGRSGNEYTFLEQLHEVSLSLMRDSDYAPMVAERGVTAATLKDWGLCLSLTLRQWIVPGYSPEGKVRQLYRLMDDPKTKRKMWWATPLSHHDASKGEVKSALFAPSSWVKSGHGPLYVCEGLGDGMRLYQFLRESKTPGQIIAVPGAGIWHNNWGKVTDEKSVYLLYDNDKAGLDGMKNAVLEMVNHPECEPDEIKYINWSSAKSLYRDGYDIRDMFKDKDSGRTTKSGPSPAWKEIESLIAPVPEEWESQVGPTKRVLIQPTPCDSWKDVVNQGQRAVKWSDGMEGGLAVMLAAITSVKSRGRAQCWFKMISPPSSGKTILCEWVSTNRKYCYPKSNFTGFFSGYKEDKDGTKDFSLAPKLNGKALITKDGDPLLQSPHKSQIFGDARDIYDMAARKEYRQGQSKDYENLRMVWLLCGTASLREIDKSELGQRFLDWVIWDEIPDEIENEVIERAIFNQARNSMIESNCSPESAHEPAYIQAMQMTGGYIDYLRKNWIALLEKIDQPPEILNGLIAKAKFISYLRARPVEFSTDKGTREIGARLGEQLTKIAQFLAVVQQVDSIAHPDVTNKIQKIVMDTSRGRTMEIAKTLAKEGELTSDTLARFTNQEPKLELKYLQFLASIKAVELTDAGKATVGNRHRWTLTQPFRKVWKEVVKKGA